MSVFQACCSSETRHPTDIPIQQPDGPSVPLRQPNPPSTNVPGRESASGVVERGMELTAELQQLTERELKARATNQHLPAAAIQGAEGSPDPKKALIALLVTQDAVVTNAPNAQRGAVDYVFDSLDADGDGAWTADELPLAPVTRSCFSFLDSDGDGRVTKTELIAAFTALGGMALMYASKNGVPPQLHAVLSIIPGATSVLPPAAKS